MRAEHEYVVLPLRDADAVSLFHERVRAAGVELAANGEVEAICRRLDHLPLAIELAAARIKVLPLAALLARLEQRLPLLTRGRARPSRAAAHAARDDRLVVRLLTTEEQRVFARLAVFAGGCTLRAAEQICDAHLDTLQSLVEKSLLRQSEGRFSMLQTIREYAGERFEESGEADEVRRAHAGFFVELAERRTADLRGRDAALWLERFEDEHDNFRLGPHLLAGRGGRRKRTYARGSPLAFLDDPRPSGRG